MGRELALLGSLRKGDAVRDFFAGDGRGFVGAGGRAFLGAAGAVGGLEGDERGDDRRLFEEQAVGFARQAGGGADALAVEEHGVAQHVRGVGDRRGDDVELADREFPAFYGWDGHSKVLTTRFCCVQVAQYSSPRFSTRRLRTVSALTRSVLVPLSSGAAPAARLP